MSMFGRRWSRPEPAHPGFCARDHRCNAGEHRSDPLRFTAPYGPLVASRIELADHRGYLELSASVRLDPVPELARRQAQELAVGVDLIIRAVLANPEIAIATLRSIPAGAVR